MDPKTAQILLGAAGSGGAGERLYVDDVFSVNVWEGNNNSNRLIDVGFDLSGEGGLVWLKARTTTESNNLFDTERGAEEALFTNSTTSQDNYNNRLKSFRNNGFKVGSDDSTNKFGTNYCSWTFRKAPGFFDVVTYTGTGSVQTISHNLGSVPGMIIIHGVDISTNWSVFHRSLGNTKYLRLNSNGSAQTSSTYWNDTDPTSTQFTVGTAGAVNTSGYEFVAYIFAHDDQSFGSGSDESIIKCGTWDGTGSATNVDVGFEPQWLMVKSDGDADEWYIYDQMRGFTADDVDSRMLRANRDFVESTNDVHITSTGFRLAGSQTNKSYADYYYVAIRRPHKPPEAATDVFDVNTESNDNNYSTTGFPVDAAISNNRDGSSHTSLFGAKLMGEYVHRTGLTNIHAAYLTYDTAYAFMDKFRYAFWGANTNGFVNYAFKRAPGFFDVVAYNGTGSAGTFNHNLEAEPELMIVKARTRADDWNVYSKPTGNSAYFRLNKTEAINNNVVIWNNTTPTSSVFSLAGDGYGVNNSGHTYVAYLFASLDGISKVGTYTGTGSSIDVDCGFSAGARFVLIKRTDAAADWAVFDSERGIVSGNDPYWSPNNDAAENSNLDAIDPLNSGFTITSTASTMLNASGGTYLFLAIA